MSGFTLTNYWLLLIWIVIAAVVARYFFHEVPEEVMGKREYRWPLPVAIIMVMPYIIWAGNRLEGYGDTGIYRRGFLEDYSGFAGIPDIIMGEGKDKGFSVFRAIMAEVLNHNDIVYFTIIAAFQMICLAVIYRKYSENFLMSLFLFIVSTDYMSWTFNGIRQFIAAAGIFACTGLMLKKKYIPLILLILIFSTIHGSALLMIPVVFMAQGKAWNTKTVFVIFIILLSVAYLDRFTDLLSFAIENTQYDDIMTNGIWAVDDGTSWQRVLVYSVPAILSLVGKPYIDEANDPIINLSVNMSVMAAGFYVLSAFTSGIYIGRIPIYMSLYSYIAIPWLINHMFSETSKQAVQVIMVLLYLAFFYYQMHNTWGLI